MMQAFMDNGNLFPGIHPYKIDDFHKQFIEGFTGSESREKIYSSFCSWISELNSVLPPAYVWLDGSYLTTKLNPKDIDLVVFYNVQELMSQRDPEETVKLIDHIIDTRSRELLCDAYKCYLFIGLPTSQASHQWDAQEKYWMGQFGFDRQKQPKGIIQIEREDLIRIGGGSL